MAPETRRFSVGCVDPLLHGVHLIAVILGSDDSYKDVRKLLDFGFATRG